jgi:LCP family protein required for cell wall assembly
MHLMPRTRWGVAWRGLVSLIVVVGCAAGATATAGLLKVKDVVNVLNTQKPIKTDQLSMPASGQPQTLLLVGVDHRYGEGKNPGNTDTMMLVRIDDSSATINALSIPRDLAVNIPGVGMSKINAAYSAGGPTLLLKTLKADVFPDLQVNQLLLVDFSSFANLINAIGCVYAPVDHRYYNENVGTAATDYSGIDIQPGYQRMCGGSGSNLGGATSALAFVRFRHNDNDFVREARQQDFLRWAKEGFSSGQLLSNQTQLLDDFGHDVQTDHLLHTTSGLIELFDLAINANGSTLKSIPFPFGPPVSIGGEDAVSFSETDSEAAYQKFLTPTNAPAGGTAVTTPTSPPTTGKHKRPKHAHAYVPPAGMTADPDDGTSQAAHLDRPGLPIYYPEYIPEGYSYCFSLTGNCNIGYEPASAYAGSYPRHYEITGTDGKHYPSYVMTLNQTSTVGLYATVQGTTWTGVAHEAGPPILRKPTAEKIVNHRLLYEYSQGGALTLVAWQTSGAVYWIANNLENTIPNPEMVAMAASFTRAGAS